MDYFNYENGELMVENVSLARIAAEVGAPAYVYSRAAFVGRLKAFEAAFADVDHLVCYSVKVNANLSLLRLAAAGGYGADIVSGGELFKALRADFRPERIVFSGVGKTAREMAEALEAGILMFNVESEEELEVLAKTAADKNKRARVALRVNPDVDPKTHPYIATGLSGSKFGISHKEAPAVYARAAASPALEAAGVACHIGSQLTDAAPFADAAARLRGLTENLRAAGVDLKYMDMGGGLGIAYREGETPPTPAEYAARIKNVVDGLGVKLILEPGRFVAGNSGVLLATVLYNKQNGAKRFVVTDCAMNDLIRPSLYGAWHDIVPVRKSGAPPATVDVVGPVCESGDFMGKDRPLQPLVAGDLLAVKGAGAYGFAMSSNYNARPRAVEVLVDGDNFKIIKPRETYEDLVRGE
ncbi:MAG: diaminopimelate decarboxylase [Candidatus Adiutrix sp.]|nr:diaminopimelate decarboxylase [Candidatus Adiutrix sp.]